MSDRKPVKSAQDVIHENLHDSDAIYLERIRRKREDMAKLREDLDWMIENSLRLGIPVRDIANASGLSVNKLAKRRDAPVRAALKAHRERSGNP